MALPGEKVGSVSASEIGNGVHIQNSDLHASIAGPILSEPTTSKASKLPTLSIGRSARSVVPEVGTVILGKITRTNARQANITIIALGSSGQHVCRDAFPALIRQQDIRAFEVDKAKITESFRVGDVVRAVVNSLGDEKSYYLSTARNELGVVMANSEWGNQMYPISWKEFQDPQTGVKELRKVAKPL